jgi:hypothetical protein
LQAQLDYLEKRRPLIAYTDFQQHGLPIGDGCVESANKLVVESRLKQAGMRWAPEHVNPLVTLRNVAGNDCWSEAWPQIVEQRHEHVRQHGTTPTEPARGDPPLLTPAVTSHALAKPKPAVVEVCRSLPSDLHPKRNHPIVLLLITRGNAHPLGGRAFCQLLTQKSDAYSFSASILTTGRRLVIIASINRPAVGLI